MLPIADWEKCRASARLGRGTLVLRVNVVGKALSNVPRPSVLRPSSVAFASQELQFVGKIASLLLLPPPLSGRRLVR